MAQNQLRTITKKDMRKKLLLGSAALLLVALTFQSAAPQEPVMTKEDGMTVINTTTLGSQFIGYTDITPVKIYIQKNKVVKVEALKNQETPKYFAKVKKQILDKWNGLKVNDAQKLKVDAVTGATMSSDAVIGNVQAGLDYYKKNSKKAK
jgi:electron transport complex protein RnfG